MQICTCVGQPMTVGLRVLITAARLEDLEWLTCDGGHTSTENCKYSLSCCAQVDSDLDSPAVANLGDQNQSWTMQLILLCHVRRHSVICVQFNTFECITAVFVWHVRASSGPPYCKHCTHPWKFGTGLNSETMMDTKSWLSFSSFLSVVVVYKMEMKWFL